MENNLQVHRYIAWKSGGFSLIELLTVVAIIGILSSIVLASFGGSRQRARDSERITEVGQITLALEMYYNACRQYPAPSSNALNLSANNGAGGTCPNSLTLGSFLSAPVPAPPEGGNYAYYTNAGNTAYVVKALLETNDAALASDIDDSTLPSGITSSTVGGCDDGPTGTPPRYRYCRKN